MLKEPKKVRLEPGTDFLRLLEDVKADKEPRVVEKEGELIAAIVSLEDLDRILTPTPSAAGIARALKAAGAWKDLDTDAMVEKIYRARHEAPPSQPVRL